MAPEESCWVQCDQCQQWRNLPGCTKEEYEEVQAMARWTCSMNRWDPTRASCSQPEEILDSGTPTRSNDPSVIPMRRQNGSYSKHTNGRRTRGAGVGRKLLSRLPLQHKTHDITWESQLGNGIFQHVSTQQQPKVIRNIKDQNVNLRKTRTDELENDQDEDQNEDIIMSDEESNRDAVGEEYESPSTVMQDVIDQNASDENDDAMPRLRPRRPKEAPETIRLPRVTSVRKRRPRLGTLDNQKLGGTKLRRCNSKQLSGLVGACTFSEKRMKEDRGELQTKQEGNDGSCSDSSEHNQNYIPNTGDPRKRRVSGHLVHQRSDSSREPVTSAKRFKSGGGQEKHTDFLSQATAPSYQLPQIDTPPLSQPQPELYWAACDACAKWRSLPGCTKEEYEKIKNVRFICSENRWDLTRNWCAAPEEHVEAQPLPPGVAEFNAALTHGLACLYRRVLLSDQIRRAQSSQQPQEIIHLLKEKLNEPIGMNTVLEQFPMKGFPWNEFPLAVLESLCYLIAPSKKIKQRMRSMTDLIEAWDTTRILLVKYFILNVPYFMESITKVASCYKRIVSTLLQPSFNLSAGDDLFKKYKFSSSEAIGIVTLLKALLKWPPRDGVANLTSRDDTSIEEKLNLRDVNTDSRPFDVEKNEDVDIDKEAIQERLKYLCGLFDRLRILRSIDCIGYCEIEAVLEFMELLESLRRCQNVELSDTKKTSIIFNSEFGKDIDQKLRKMIQALPGKIAPDGLKPIFISNTGSPYQPPRTPLPSHTSPPVTLFRISPPVLNLHPLNGRVVLSGGPNVPQIVATEVLPRIITLHPSPPPIRAGRAVVPSVTSSVNNGSNLAQTVNCNGTASSVTTKSIFFPKGPTLLAAQSGQPLQNSGPPNVAASLAASLIAATCSVSPSLTTNEASVSSVKEGLSLQVCGRTQSRLGVQKGVDKQSSRPVLQVFNPPPVSSDTYRLDLPGRFPWPGVEELSDCSETSDEDSITSDSSDDDRDSDPEDFSDMWNMITECQKREKDEELKKSRKWVSWSHRFYRGKEFELWKELSKLSHSLGVYNDKVVSGENYESTDTQYYPKVTRRCIRRWLDYHQGDIIALATSSTNMNTLNAASWLGPKQVVRDPIKRSESTVFHKSCNKGLSPARRPSASPFSQPIISGNRRLNYRLLRRRHVPISNEANGMVSIGPTRTISQSPRYEPSRTTPTANPLSRAAPISFAAAIPETNGNKIFVPINPISAGVRESNYCNSLDMASDWSLRAGLSIVNGPLLRASRRLTHIEAEGGCTTRNKGRGELSPVHLRKKRVSTDLPPKSQILAVLTRMESVFEGYLRSQITGKENENPNKEDEFNENISNADIREKLLLSNSEGKSWREALYRQTDINRLVPEDEFLDLCVLISSLNKLLHRCASSLAFLHAVLFSVNRQHRRHSKRPVIVPSEDALLIPKEDTFSSNAVHGGVRKEDVNVEVSTNEGPVGPVLAGFSQEELNLTSSKTASESPFQAVLIDGQLTLDGSAEMEENMEGMSVGEISVETVTTFNVNADRPQAIEMEVHSLSKDDSFKETIEGHCRNTLSSVVDSKLVDDFLSPNDLPYFKKDVDSSMLVQKTFEVAPQLELEKEASPNVILELDDSLNTESRKDIEESNCDESSSVEQSCPTAYHEEIFPIAKDTIDPCICNSIIEKEKSADIVSIAKMIEGTPFTEQSDIYNETNSK